MGIMDIVIIVAILLFALIGMLRGGARMFFGFFLLLIIMLCSSFISVWICPHLLRTETDDGVSYNVVARALMTPIESVLPSGGGFGELLDEEVTKGDDGKYYIGEATLDEAMTEAIAIPYVGGLIASFAETAAHNGESLRTSIAFLFVDYTLEVIVWVNLVIMLAIIRNIFRKKLYIYLDKNFTPNMVDRGIGTAFSLVILLVLLWGIGAWFAHFDNGSNWANGVDTYLTTKGPLCSFIMVHNPFLKLMHVTIPIT